MRIHELARRTGVSIRSLRYYEQKQLITARRLNNGYRDFDEAAIERVRTIQLYFGLGLNTDQIEQIMNCNGTHAFPQKNPLCDEVLSLYEEKLQEVEEQITALDAVRSRLHERIATFKWMKTTSSSHNADADPSPAKAEKPWESADELNTLP
jgi:MerR family Zn(II)-responsive transcriptional regulator of zntA